MKYIVPVLCGIVMLIFIAGVIAFLRQPKATEKGKVQLPKAFAIVGSISSVLFLTVTVITYLKKEPLWVNLIFIFAALLGIVLIMAFVNYRITYDEDGFVYRNFWGIKREFTYSQVTGIKEDLSECCVYIGKRKVTVECLSTGGIMFAAIIKKKYSDFHGGQKIPEVKPKHDIFNGHVKDAAGFWAANIIVTAFLVGFLVFFTYEIYSPTTESDAVEHSVTFTSYEEADEEIVLTTADKKIFKIKFPDEQFNGEKIKEVCNGEITVTTYSKEVDSSDNEDYFSLKAIKYNDNYILSFAETDRLRTEEYSPGIIFLMGMLIVWWIYIILAIIVGRNPQKFSKKVVSMFFKDGYINY